YEEMLEMASQGARVLQTRSVELAMNHRVRLQVLSSFTDTPGTLVVDEDEIVEKRVVSGIAYSRDEAKITVQRVADRPGVAAAIFGPLADNAINVDMIVQNISADGKTDLTFTVSRADLDPDLAVMGGAMTWVSERNLVAAISNAGGFGVIASGSMSPTLLDQEITATKALTARPFGVNLITMHPQLLELIDACVEHRVGHVVLAGGIPTGAAMQRIRAGGARVVCFAPALVLAKKLVRMGADAIVIEGSEAGGHIGPVSTAVLAQEVLPHLTEVPVFVAGGIGRGEAILSYLEMGASGVQLGTRFVCAHESIAHPLFKRAFIRASARDAVASVQLDARFPVIPVRALANPATDRFR